MVDQVCNSMRLEFLSQPENIGLARIAVAAFAAQIDMTLDELEEIKVAISEAVTNAIVHGYQGQPDALVRIEATRYVDRLVFVVQDFGKGMPQTHGQDLDSGHLGLGFMFMKSFMDHVEVDSREGEGTTVRLIKRLNHAGLGMQVAQES
ncbi:MAG: anti-sigma F factor [Clostridia bacterium]|nr:anti-sigma F factor [Clostridia bacterium]